jgi:hypothetical protein
MGGFGVCVSVCVCRYDLSVELGSPECEVCEIWIY